MNELSFLPVKLRLGAEIQHETKNYRVVSINRNETDKCQECEIKIETVERFMRKPTKYAIHKEPGGPVRIIPIK